MAISRPACRAFYSLGILLLAFISPVFPETEDEQKALLEYFNSKIYPEEFRDVDWKEERFLWSKDCRNDCNPCGPVYQKDQKLNLSNIACLLAAIRKKREAAQHPPVKGKPNIQVRPPDESQTVAALGDAAAFYDGNTRTGAGPSRSAVIAQGDPASPASAGILPLKGVSQARPQTAVPVPEPGDKPEDGRQRKFDRELGAKLAVSEALSGMGSFMAPFVEKELYGLKDLKLRLDRARSAYDLLSVLRDASPGDMDLGEGPRDFVEGLMAEYDRILSLRGKDDSFERRLADWQDRTDGYLEISKYSFKGEEDILKKNYVEKLRAARMAPQSSEAYKAFENAADALDSFQDRHPALAAHAAKLAEHQVLNRKALAGGLAPAGRKFAPRDLGFDLPYGTVIEVAREEGRPGYWVRPEAGSGGKERFVSADGRLLIEKGKDPETGHDVSTLQELDEKGLVAVERTVDAATGMEISKIAYNQDGSRVIEDKLRRTRTVIRPGKEGKEDARIEDLDKKITYETHVEAGETKIDKAYFSGTEHEPLLDKGGKLAGVKLGFKEGEAFDLGAVKRQLSHLKAMGEVHDYQIQEMNDLVNRCFKNGLNSKKDAYSKINAYLLFAPDGSPQIRVEYAFQGSPQVTDDFLYANGVMNHHRETMQGGEKADRLEVWRGYAPQAQGAQGWGSVEVYDTTWATRYSVQADWHSAKAHNYGRFRWDQAGGGWQVVAAKPADEDNMWSWAGKRIAWTFENAPVYKQAGKGINWVADRGTDFGHLTTAGTGFLLGMSGSAQHMVYGLISKWQAPALAGKPDTPERKEAARNLMRDLRAMLSPKEYQDWLSGWKAAYWQWRFQQEDGNLEAMAAARGGREEVSEEAIGEFLISGEGGEGIEGAAKAFSRKAARSEGGEKAFNFMMAASVHAFKFTEQSLAFEGVGAAAGGLSGMAKAAQAGRLVKAANAMVQTANFTKDVYFTSLLGQQAVQFGDAMTSGNREKQLDALAQMSGLLMMPGGNKERQAKEGFRKVSFKEMGKEMLGTGMLAGKGRAVKELVQAGRTNGWSGLAGWFGYNSYMKSGKLYAGTPEALAKAANELGRKDPALAKRLTDSALKLDAMKPEELLALSDRLGRFDKVPEAKAAAGALLAEAALRAARERAGPAARGGRGGPAPFVDRNIFLLAARAGDPSLKALDRAKAEAAKKFLEEQEAVRTSGQALSEAFAANREAIAKNIRLKNPAMPEEDVRSEVEKAVAENTKRDGAYYKGLIESGKLVVQSVAQVEPAKIGGYLKTRNKVRELLKRNGLSLEDAEVVAGVIVQTAGEKEARFSTMDGRLARRLKQPGVRNKLQKELGKIQGDLLLPEVEQVEQGAASADVLKALADAKTTVRVRGPPNKDPSGLWDETGPADGGNLVQTGYGYRKDPSFTEPMGQAIESAKKELIEDIRAGRPISTQRLREVMDEIARTRRRIAEGKQGQVPDWRNFGAAIPEGVESMDAFENQTDLRSWDREMSRSNTIDFIYSDGPKALSRHDQYYKSASVLLKKRGIKETRGRMASLGEVESGGAAYELSLLVKSSRKIDGNIYDVIEVHHPSFKDMVPIRREAMRIITEAVNDPGITEARFMDRMAAAYRLLMHATPYVRGTPSIVEAFYDAILRAKFGKTLPLKSAEPFWDAMFWDPKKPYTGEDFLRNYSGRRP